MVNKTSVKYIIVFFSILLIFINSCKDKESDIGIGFIPNSDKFELKVDTFDVDCYTIPGKRVSSNIQHTYSPIGSYHDPVFGYTKAGFICQLKPTAYSPDFSKMNTINSIELELKYGHEYGDKTTPQTINVSRLLKDFSARETYYSDLKLEANEYEIITSTALTITNDSIIKVSLPISLANTLTNTANSESYKNDSAFIKFFKGLYITTNNIPSDGCIFSANLISKASKMVITYNETEKFEYEITERLARINLYEHDYTNASPDLQAAIADTTKLNNTCYIQNLAGVFTKLKFPKLTEKLKGDNIAINKASLIITIEKSEKDDIFTAPPITFVNKITEKGDHIFLPKDHVKNIKDKNPDIGGNLESNTYTFQIPFYIQNLVRSNETEYGLVLYGTKNKINPYRVVLNGANGTVNRMKIVVFYTELK